ncbi:MAG: type II CAAX endopeptidase family protein [bacterium]|nr:CPBP family intramembrane metalloprotease [bacterium]MBU1917561.1 CPBP family intramembrane metalloprotease [bacterium]
MKQDISSYKTWNAPYTLLFWIVLMLTTQIPVIVLSVVLFALNPDLLSADTTNTISQNGLLVSLATLLQTPFVLLLCVFFISLKKIPVKTYLALESFSLKQLLYSLFIITSFVLILSFTMYQLNLNHGFEWFKSIWFSSNSKALLCFVVIFIAPLNEELIYRGVLFTGLQQSKLGPIGAIVITAALWAIIHLQYQLIDIGVVFLGGLILGYARYLTRSLYIPFIMHIVWNAIVTAIFLYRIY